MERYGKEVTVKEVVKKARCSNCGQKNNFEFRIIYIGGSYDAMLGGTTKQKNLTLFLDIRFGPLFTDYARVVLAADTVPNATTTLFSPILAFDNRWRFSKF